MREPLTILALGLLLIACPLMLGCASAPAPEEPEPEAPPESTTAEDAPAGEAPVEDVGLVPVTTTDSSARALFEAGRVKEERARPAEAAEDFRAAVEKDPDFALAWLHLASVARNSREYDDACAHAVAAKPRVSEDERLVIDAAVAEHDGRVEAAQGIWQEICRRHPADARARYRLGLSYWMTEDAKAVVHMEKAVELYPGLDVAWNMLGYVYSSLGRSEDAVRAHRRYVDLLPQEPNAHDSLAESLMKAGEFEESITQYQKALELDPGFHWSRLGIGHNQVFLGRYLEAAQSYQQALSEAGGLFEQYQAAEALVVLGVYAGDPEAALAATDKAIELAAQRGEVERAWAVRLLARVQLWAGKAAEAQATALEALAMLPDNASDTARESFEEAVLRLGVETRLARDDPAGARGALAKLEEVAGASESTWQRQLASFTKGYVLLEDGKPEAAAAALSEASQSDPRVLFYLAQAVAALGRTEEARELLRRVVDWNSPSLGHAMVLARAKELLGE